MDTDRLKIAKRLQERMRSDLLRAEAKVVNLRESLERA